MSTAPGGHVHPTRDDAFLASFSEGVGGPVGTRAGRHPWWTPVRVVLALAAVCLALGLVQKSGCYADSWQNGQERYTQMCYSDLPYLYTGRQSTLSSPMKIRNRPSAIDSTRRPLALVTSPLPCLVG